MSQKTVLDKNGLSYLWSKIKALIPTNVSTLTNDSNYQTQTDVNNAITNSIDTTLSVFGKAADAAKVGQALADIAENAELNVNADWNATSGDAMILNKPTIPTKVSELTNDSNFIDESDMDEITAAEVETLLEDAEARPSDILSDIFSNYVTTTTFDQSMDEIDTMRNALNQKIDDVQLNGVSIVENGVANVPVASTYNTGVIRTNSDRGLSLNSEGLLSVSSMTNSMAKNGTNQFKPVVANIQHISTFYGLAKAAGADMASSSNPVGTYTEEAKIAIQKMLGVYREWELIAEYTVPEDTTQLNIIADLNGQSFALSDMLVRAWLEPATTGTNSYVGSAVLVVNSDNEDTSAPGTTKRYMTNGAKTFFEYVINLMCGVCITFARSASGSGSTSSVESISSTYDNNKYIRGFRLYRYSDTSSLIPAGSVIKIYGIRV